MDSPSHTQSPAPIPSAPFPFFGKLSSYYARVRAWGEGLTAQVRELQALLTQAVATLRGSQQENQALRDEIARLKGLSPRPRQQGSAMDKRTEKAESEDKPDDGSAGGTDEGPGTGEGKRPGSAKRSKTAGLKIHQEVVVKADYVPQGAVFNGHCDYVVQDLIVTSHNTRIRREMWLLLDGTTFTAAMPPEYRCGHFGAQLRAFVLTMHRQGHVSQQTLHELLLDLDVDISEGQVNAIVNEGHEAFHAEAAQVLKAGLLASPAITVDDTAVRHQGESGVATNVSGPHFAWFCSTESKTRLNFLELLHAGPARYEFNTEAVDYMARYGCMPFELFDKLRELRCTGDLEWLEHLLDEQGIVNQGHRLTLTEAALWGGLTGQRHADLAIVSDGARQFIVGPLHGLCWVHTERLYLKLIPGSDEHRRHQERVRGQIWALYTKLKAYKRAPKKATALLLRQEFEAIFSQKTGFDALDAQLARTLALQEHLLLVLRRPDVPLHTNQSETDIRDYVKVRKISGGTRSNTGRRCRDTFTTLVKTCRKNGVSFMHYVVDRITHAQSIPSLADLVRTNTAAATA